MTLRTYFALLLTCCSASAQFASLTTTRDGSVVYFATPLRQKNTAQPDHGKLFRFDTRITLQESRELVPPKPVPSGIAGVGKYELSNAYNLLAVSVSSDGAAVAAAASRYCIGDIVYCSKREESILTTISSGGRSQEFPGNLRLSANGKWAFGNSSIVVYASFIGFRVDVTSGAHKTFSGSDPFHSIRVASAGRPVANDGTAVFCDQSTLNLVREEKSQRLTLENYDQPTEAVIDAAARVIVYSVIHNTGSGSFVNLSGDVKSLHAVPVEGGDPWVLDAEGYSPSISDDGSRILYLRRVDGVAQVWMINTDGTSRRQLTSESAGVSSATLSGDGDMAYAVTFGARIIRIATASGEISEVVPRTPWLDSNDPTSPGRFTVIHGVGFAASDATQVTIQGRPMRVLAIEPEAISILVPPDVQTTSSPGYSGAVVLTASPESPFDSPRSSIQINDYEPGFLLIRPGLLFSSVLAAHEDWSGLVTEAAPARAGEVIHTYAAGLGATSPAVPFGETAPAAEPLARVRDMYTCTDSLNSSNPLEVHYQGLAPGMIGIYQMDIRWSQESKIGFLYLSCSLNSVTINGRNPGFSGRLPVAK